MTTRTRKPTPPVKRRTVEDLKKFLDPRIVKAIKTGSIWGWTPVIAK